MTIKLVYVINHSDSIHCGRGLCLGLGSLRDPRPKVRRYVSVFRAQWSSFIFLSDA